MATVAVPHTLSFASEKVVPFAAAKQDSKPVSESQAEIDGTARLLCALSSHTNLWGAMMSYRSDLPKDEAMLWTEQVIRRMDTIMPGNAAQNLRKTYDYATPWINQTVGTPEAGTTEEDVRVSLMSRLALPTVVLVGLGMCAMCIVGFITTYHHLFSR